MKSLVSTLGREEEEWTFLWQQKWYHTMLILSFIFFVIQIFDHMIKADTFLLSQDGIPFPEGKNLVTPQLFSLKDSWIGDIKSLGIPFHKKGHIFPQLKINIKFVGYPTFLCIIFSPDWGCSTGILSSFFQFLKKIVSHSKESFYA